MSFDLENAIRISDPARAKVRQLMDQDGIGQDPSYFLRVSVVSGGCSGLSYKIDFDNVQKPGDQVFRDNDLT
ncbi:MAG TPA: hypothetical protein VG870_02985, partial [Chitinophagaceae bacterium]|nr:hypothetical protein [Chitinophagaceae bacterium]